jgi:hypothetical protein
MCSRRFHEHRIPGQVRRARGGGKIFICLTSTYTGADGMVESRIVPAKPLSKGGLVREAEKMGIWRQSNRKRGLGQGKF